MSLINHFICIKLSKKFYRFICYTDYEQAQIEELFTPFGIVSECFVPTDKWTGKSRGFAFVTMADKASGEAAVQALDQSQVGDRTIKVNEQLTKDQLQQRPPKKSGRKGKYAIKFP